jgi:hypothetical protein
MKLRFSNENSGESFMLEVIKHSARFDASPFMGVNGSKARTIKELYGLYC